MIETSLIHLVDDDEAVRHSTSLMLRQAGFRVQTYTDGISFLRMIGSVEKGCILLDVRMPVMDGLEVQAALIERGIAWPVIVLTGHSDVKTAVQTMKAGAVDFIEKPYETSALIAALRAALEQLSARRPQRQFEIEAHARIKQLSPRETDILRGLARGLTNKAIAQEIGISPRTVEIHRANMKRKLEVSSLSSALRLAFATGMGS